MINKHTFFAPSLLEGDVVLPDTETRHALRVLRLSVGDGATLVDGRGHRASGIVKAAEKNRLVVTVQHVEAQEPFIKSELTVAAALLKNAGRFETMLEKVSELGARRVVPLLTKRSERTRFRLDRARSIAVSAMKQCGSSHLTEVVAPLRFSDFLDASEGACLICHEKAPTGADVVSRLGKVEGVRITFAVGPEGGFSDEEVSQAFAAGFLPTSLGPSRLRAGTASVAAVAAAAFYYNKD